MKQKRTHGRALDERVDDDDTGFDITAREGELMHKPEKKKPLSLAQIREAAKARGDDNKR